MNNEIRELYNSQKSILKYASAIDEVGLWESEKIIIEKYIDKNVSIIDLGCGAGRTTINLFKLGYKNIVGIDFANNLIRYAQKYCIDNNLDIQFDLGDVTNLPYDNNSFDAALFSYNGLMCIPQKKNRIKTLLEIKRVLKSNSIFIFTAHNREESERLKELWQRKKQDWNNGIRDKNTYDFGDLWTKDNNGTAFIHFATRNEITDTLIKYDFEIIEIINRDSLVKEKSSILRFSGNTDFYVCKSLN